jgi:ubiquinone/menaquinone biosynthesis C-methylase UbiE
MTQADYVAYYASLRSISRGRETDLNRRCLAQIDKMLGSVAGKRILDAGCGNGFLARWIRDSHPALEVTSVEIFRPEAELPGDFCQAQLHALPFQSAAFDLVICSHTLEHCLNADAVLVELKRVCAGVLIIVVPQQRPYYYTMDEHVQFYYYEEQLTKAVGLREFECQSLVGDWFYRGFVETAQPLEAQPPSLSLNPSK